MHLSHFQLPLISMSGAQNFFQARRDMPEGRAPSREQAQKVQLALNNLNPSLTLLQAQRARGLSHRSSVSCFSSSTTTPDGTLRIAHRSPLPTPAEGHQVVDPPTSPNTIAIQSIDYSSTHPTLVLDLPLSQLPPLPPSPRTKRRRRFSMLNFPLEFIVSTIPMNLGHMNACDHDEAQKNALTLLNEHDGTTCDPHISSAEGRSGDHLRPSVPVTQHAESRAVQETHTTWTLEKNGRRIDLKQRDYQLVLELLRKL